MRLEQGSRYDLVKKKRYENEWGPLLAEPILILRIRAGSARKPAPFPELFPIPHPGRHLVRQGEPELMREHAHLPAVVSFVGNHVAQHFRSHRPRLGPAISVKFLDASVAAKRLGKHVRTAGSALRQSRTRLLRRAGRAIELPRDLQMWSCKPDPLGTDIVHVGEDCSDGADLARGFGSPGGGLEIFDQELIDAIVSGKDLDSGSAELRGILG